MIVIALLAAAQATPAPITPGEVVVIGRRLERLKQLRIVTKHDRATGATGCVYNVVAAIPCQTTRFATQP